MKAFKWWWDILLAFSLLAVLRMVAPLPFTNEILIFSIYTMGCNFLLGRVGFISFGQPAYLAVGAYATAFYLYYFGQNPYIGILLGILAGLVVSALVGPFFVRLRSDYFALVNLALAVIVFYMMEKVLASITHGDNGLWFLANMASTPVVNISTPSGFFIFAFVVAIAIWAFYKYLDDSIYGACCLATKINEDKLQFLGYSNFQYPLAGLCDRQYDDGLGRLSLRRLFRVRQPGNQQPRPSRRPGRGHDPGRRGDALRAHRGRDRVYRHEGPGQRCHRQLGTPDRLPIGLHHAGRGKGYLGLGPTAPREGPLPEARAAGS